MVGNLQMAIREHGLTRVLVRFTDKNEKHERFSGTFCLRKYWEDDDYFRDYVHKIVLIRVGDNTDKESWYMCDIEGFISRGDAEIVVQ